MRIPKASNENIFLIRLEILEEERFSKKESTKKAEACTTLSAWSKSNQGFSLEGINAL
jgi:hypothetical protein